MYITLQFEQLRRARMLMDYNLWSPLSSSKNAIVIEHVFTDVAVVFPKLSNRGSGTGGGGGAPNIAHDVISAVLDHVVLSK